MIAAALVSGMASSAGAQTRKVVHSGDDLPRFSYSTPDSAAAMLTSSPQHFERFAKPVVADIDRTLAAYEVTDKATLRAMLRARLAAEIATGQDDAAALQTVAAIRAQEDKAEARLEGGLVYQAFLEARLKTHDSPGVCPTGFAVTYTGLLAALPWSVVATRIKLEKRACADRDARLSSPICKFLSTCRVNPGARQALQQPKRGEMLYDLGPCDPVDS